ncbi:MAG: leucine--tRNA ligase [Acidimicrobiia bacterium]
MGPAVPARRGSILPAVTETTDTTPQYRYSARLANELEGKWQDYWDAHGTFETPNPTGPMATGFAAAKQPLFVLDMFPYPSGAGLHVGHPLGYIGTDVYARFKRMTGHNVLYSMGFDAFGLPAEQYAIQTGQHPRISTEDNVANMRRQLRALGLSHDRRRSISTTDVPYYRWTQWIFLQIFNSFYDTELQKARPIGELIEAFEAGTRAPEGDVRWDELDHVARRELIDSYRLAYLADATVNWCPALGTVLANEEVTADGRSERGNYPVYRRPMKQWMMRITAYAERLLNDLDALDWTDSIKLMQRNWIGRSTGAYVTFTAEGPEGEVDLEVFTTRPDTLFGATYMVVAPEHPLLDDIVANAWPDSPETWRGLWGLERSPVEALHAYRDFAAAQSEIERQTEGKEKTGVFTGAHAINPVNGARIPIFVADYVLMGYGTGAIMAVPAHDQRDFDFAREFDLPITAVVQPTDAWCAEHGVASDAPADTWPVAFTGDGALINSTNGEVTIEGLAVPDAILAITDWLSAMELGRAAVTYRLRDWLFSRQRYWGEPFPIVYDGDGLPVALPESMLPVELPELFDFEPRIVDEGDESIPEPPLSRAVEWAVVDLDLPGDPRGPGAHPFRRELNVMPQWAGSCWYYLRYLDPENNDAMVDPDVEQYWMNKAGNIGGVDLYVGGVEHAVLHLLYARFWHKVLFDLGHVSTSEPFQRLFNQGYIQAYAYTDARGVYVPAEEVETRDGEHFYNGAPVIREYGKMGKSLKNIVTPDDMYRDYGADTLRLYEMFMGPLDASRPWSTADIPGVHRFLQRFWRNCVDEDTGALRIVDAEPSLELRKVMHRTIDAVRRDYDALSFNTAVARLFECNNALTSEVQAHGGAPLEVVTAMTLMLAPLAPHISEEMWQRLGNTTSLTYAAFPEADPALLVDDEVEIPVQINGKVRGRVLVAADASEAELEASARKDETIAGYLSDVTVRKVIAVPGRLINFVVG